jgi:hypothetical protein
LKKFVEGKKCYDITPFYGFPPPPLGNLYFFPKKTA